MKIYAIPTQGSQYLCKEKFKPVDAVEMLDTKKSEDEVCQDNGDGTGKWVKDTNAVEPGPLKDLSKKQKVEWIEAQGLDETLTSVLIALIKD